MSKRRTPKRPRDVNALAKLVVDLAAGKAEDEPERKPDAAAVKRGDARAAKLSPRERQAIAKKAARARWKKE